MPNIKGLETSLDSKSGTKTLIVCSLGLDLSAIKENKIVARVRLNSLLL